MHPELAKLRSKLQAHDWHYQMSDDRRAHDRGERGRNEIQVLVNRLGYDGQRLYNAYHAINFNPSTGCCWNDYDEPTGKRLRRKDGAWEFDES